MEIINSTGQKLRIREVTYAHDKHGLHAHYGRWEPFVTGDAIAYAGTAHAMEIAEIECEDGA